MLLALLLLQFVVLSLPDVRSPLSPPPPLLSALVEPGTPQAAINLRSSRFSALNVSSSIERSGVWGMEEEEGEAEEAEGGFFGTALSLSAGTRAGGISGMSRFGLPVGREREREIDRDRKGDGGGGGRGGMARANKKRLTYMQ